jgi:hypothetical protein
MKHWVILPDGNAKILSIIGFVPVKEIVTTFAEDENNVVTALTVCVFIEKHPL